MGIDTKTIVLLVFLLFSMIIASFVALGLINITGVYLRLTKHSTLMNMNTLTMEIIKPTSHSYWPIYYNGEYYWTWVAIKSNKELEQINLVTSFPLIEPPEIIQTGFDGTYYYYRVIMKTHKKPDMIEWLELPANTNNSGGHILLYPQIEDVEGVGGVEIVAVIVKDMEVLPSLITFQMYKQLLQQYEKGIFVIFQNTGDDIEYRGSVITINGQEVTPEKLIREDGSEIQDGDIIKSGETFTAIIVGIPPESVDKVQANVESDKGTITIRETKVLVGDEVKSGGSQQSPQGETPQPVTLPSALYLNYDLSNPNTLTSDTPGSFGGTSPSTSFITINSYNKIGESSGLDAGLIVMNNDGTQKLTVYLGGNGGDVFNAVAKTKDGGYIAVGYTTSYGAGGKDGLVVKFSASGDVEWVRVMGFSRDDIFNSVQQTQDGGYIIGGYYYTSYPYGWAVKLDSQGNLVWSKTLGWSTVIKKIIETNTEDYVAVGYSDLSWIGMKEASIFKLDSNGNLIWSKILGSRKTDTFNDIIEDTDGNYVVVGKIVRYSTIGSGWLVKFSPEGDILMSKRVHSGGADGYSDTLEKIIQLDNGDYFVVGRYREGYSTSAGKQIIIAELTPSGQLVNKAVVSSSGHPKPTFLLKATDDVLIGFSETITTDSGSITKSGVIRWSSIQSGTLPGFTVTSSVFSASITPISMNGLSVSSNNPVIAYWNPQYIKVPPLPTWTP